MSGTMDEEVFDLLDALWDFNDPAASEKRFHDAAASQSDHAARGILLSQLARARGLQRNFDEARAALDEAERLCQAAALEDDGGHRTTQLRAMLLLERGRVLNSSGERAAARPIFEEAWQVADGEERGSALAVDAAHMLAIVTEGKESLAWNERALAAAEASADPRARRWRASLLNNLGWTYHDDGDYERALDCFQRALQARRERDDARGTLIAQWAIARCLRSLGRMDEALVQQRELLAEWDALGEQDGYVYEEIGECLVALNRAEEARPSFAAAYELLHADPWVRANEPERLARLAKLGGRDDAAGSGTASAKN